MAQQNFPDNTIYELDNLDVLRGMNSDTVDLIATDPPFNTKRNRSGTAGFYVDNWKWGDTGKLPDQWAWNEVHPIWMDEIKDDKPALFEVIEAAGACHGDDIAAFLCFLSVRLLEMHRILKPIGSLYLHCDHTANAYIRMALDAIFGAKNFRNEIVWERTKGRSDGRHWGNTTDNILFYVKSANYSWKNIYQNRLVEAEQTLGDLTAAETRNGISGAPWKGYNPTDHKRHWAVPRNNRLAEWIDEHRIPGYLQIENPRERLNALEKAGMIAWSDSGRPSIIRPAEASAGAKVNNLWNDIARVASSERTGSPDQKPLALYERIVLASSNAGDLVLDPFAGCATTIIAAQKNGRRWVGIDRRKDARFHVVCRMEGIQAKDAESIRKLPHLTDWIEARLAKHDAHFTIEPPARTDEGETAAPFLSPVYTIREKSQLTHREMKDYLLETFGLQCWGCNFAAPDERYLQIDHVEPKSDGGSNHLDNRALLCQPCNQAKSNRITISELRYRNTKEGHLTKPAGTPRGQDGHQINLPAARQNCRDALERHRIGRPLQIRMML